MALTANRPNMILLLLAILTFAVPPTSAPPSAFNLVERQNGGAIITVTTTYTTQTGTIDFCPNPCGYYAQLCCAADEICITDQNNQAQCQVQAPTRPTGGCPPWTTSTYITTITYRTATTYTVTYTRTELNVQTIIGTATYSISPQPPECCSLPPSDPFCSPELGEIQCGNICCSAGQYCAFIGQCVDLATGTTSSGSWSFYTTTYVETDLQTVTSTVSTFVGAPVPPVRPTSATTTTV